MSSHFKCLVQLNNHKYSVCIDCNYNQITFNTLYYEIRNQLKQNISYETHQFEIFDNDFKEYVSISSDKQLVNNLSRIRVFPKIDSNIDNINKNIEVLSISETEESIKCSNIAVKGNSDKTQFNANQKPINTDFNCIYTKTFEFNNYIKNETKLKNNNNEKVLAKEEVNNSSIELVVKSSKPELVAENIPLNTEVINSQSNTITNYFGFDIPECGHYSSSSQLAFETRVEKIGIISTYVLIFKSYDIKAFNKMLRIMAYNRYHFKFNPSNDLMSNQKWIIVSNQMISFCYREWSAQKCRDSFMGSINWYKKVIENAPNYEIAYRIYPLFESIHSLDLKFFLKTENFYSICRSREIFDFKLDKSTETKQKMTENVIINAVERQTYSPGIASNSKSGNDFIDYQTNNHKSQSYNSFIKKANNLSDYDIKAFHSLIQMIDSIVTQFGREVKHFWQLVSNKMIENGYHEFNAKNCENKFLNNVCDNYTLALIHSPDYKTATSIYPLFEFIHTLDLKQSLNNYSFHKIKDLRERYYYKFKANKTKYNY